jgi:hypothetical protein
MEKMPNDFVQGVPGLVYRENLIFEESVAGRVGYSLPDADVPEVTAEAAIPSHLLRDGTMPSISAPSHWARVR